MKKPHVHFSTGNSEWYTPAKFIETARAAMGGIDLDPASSFEAQKVVRARVFFTKVDDGLSASWGEPTWKEATKEQYIENLKRRYIQRLDGTWYQQGDVLPSGKLRSKAEGYTEEDLGKNYEDGIAAGYIPLASGGWCSARELVKG